MQEKCFQSNQQSLELLENLKDAEDEIEVLKNYIIDLKQRIAVYIPQKGDPIDKKLAEYINNYPDRQKLKIMFLVTLTNSMSNPYLHTVLSAL